MALTGLVGAVSSSASDVETISVLILFGLLGYIFAVRTRRTTGSTPWRLPPITWAVVSALLPLWGLMLEMVARLTTRPGGQTRSRFGGPGGLGGFSSHGYPPPGASSPAPGSAFPLQGDQPGHSPGGPQANPAGGPELWPTQVTMWPGPDGWLPSGSGLGNAPEAPPAFGWYEDPAGVHQERYWDGRSWADLVRDNGEISNAELGPLHPPWVKENEQAPVSTDV